MSTELTQPLRPSALLAMAQRFNVEPQKLLETLKGTVFAKATNEQLMALVIVANEFGLSPFTREIYAFPDTKSGGIVPVISIDGWIHRMNDHSQFDGIEFEWAEGGDSKPISCTAIIHRKDRSKATRVTEYLSECFRKTDPWINQPRRMLRHRALIQCARIAFGFSGMDPEDAEMAAMYEAKGRVIEPKRPRFLGNQTPEAPEPPPPAVDPEPSSGEAVPPQFKKPRRKRGETNPESEKTKSGNETSAVPDDLIKNDPRRDPRELLDEKFENEFFSWDTFITEAVRQNVLPAPVKFDDLDADQVTALALRFESIAEECRKEAGQ